GFTHRGGSRRGSCDHPPLGMDLKNAFFDRRVADLTGYAQLVSAGEEDSRSAVQRLQGFARPAVGTFFHIELDQVRHTQSPESLSIAVEIALRLSGGDGGDHQTSALEEAGERFKDRAVTVLV